MSRDCVCSGFSRCGSKFFDSRIFREISVAGSNSASPRKNLRTSILSLWDLLVFLAVFGEGVDQAGKDQWPAPSGADACAARELEYARRRSQKSAYAGADSPQNQQA